MKNSFNIFYSWQSDIPKNRNTIESAIVKAIKELKKIKQKEIELEINLDRDTKDNSGSPDIADTIFMKILNSDIFICDVTIINNSLLEVDKKQRLTPNPNVLIELGYAIRHLGWERIICINNIHYGKSEFLPFDIRNHRIISLNFNNHELKNDLKTVLKRAIAGITDNYDDIIEKWNANKIASHDKGIYLKINEICSENFLKESVSLAVNSLHSNNYIYSKWDALIEFYDKTINWFLDKEIDSLFKQSLTTIDSFRMICYKDFNEKETNNMRLFDYFEAGFEITEEKRIEILQSERTFAHKDAFSNETYKDADIRIQKLQNELSKNSIAVIASYQAFIIKYKEKQLE
ncbi:MAG: hypothetical protein PHU27_05235 [Salinivirgaceae bacterium]|nr:hypothetical protein [Salinivirgaceae bacterium]MDD4747381.1 hypothetical protein [Salinivirgaceae bacterium]